MEDCSNSNPRLHMFYVKTAVKHLIYFEKVIKGFGTFSNSNISEAIHALQVEKSKLIKTNTAYEDANEILESIKEDQDDKD